MASYTRPTCGWVQKEAAKVANLGASGIRI